MITYLFFCGNRANIFFKNQLKTVYLTRNCTLMFERLVFEKFAKILFFFKNWYLKNEINMT